ncbi:MAG: hypothetical protein K8R35_00190 [Bacteroidales bacterium]|nr:hypothetical protein [Bacteroidales bacterium]
MLRNSLKIIIIAALGWIFFQVYSGYSSRDELNELSTYYATEGLTEVGAANLVTSVVVTYRGLDTLGEVTILFLTALIIGLMLKVERGGDRTQIRNSSEFLVTASHVLLPVIFMVGIYIFINGHLTPGGGFQGGAILASTVILMLLSFTNNKISHKLLEIIESVSGISFILLGILGVLFAGGFLDNKILPLGEFGKLFSAGAIPVIYSLIGLKVGAELSNIILGFNQIQGKDDKSV